MIRKKLIRNKKRILLIDADSKIPNLALMKLSTFHKLQGDNVKLIKLNIPYYPNRNKKINYIPEIYDKSYCSVIFENNINFIKGENIIFGGTGYNLTTKLPKEIENLDPDYSLYPDNNISYGFISRGCIRNCYFCKVPKKEGYIKQVNKIENIIKHERVKFLDNNFLALPNHKQLLRELINLKNIRFEFNQGLDIRLIDKVNSILLKKAIKQTGGYTFAFDDWSYLSLISEKLLLLNWRKDWQLRFFVYADPKMELSNIINRINWLKDNKCLSYFMRNIKCWESKYKNFYTDLAAWCNQPNLFKKMSFNEFLDKRHSKKNRILFSKNLYYENIK